MPSLMLESLNAELTHAIIGILPVKDLCRLSQVTKRFYFLVHQFRNRLGPELICSTSNDTNSSSLTVYRDALARLHSPPQLVLFFSGRDHFQLTEDLPLRISDFPVPKGAAVLGCDSEDPIQTIHCGSVITDEACECNDNVSVMVLGGLPEETTKIQPFVVKNSGSTMEDSFLPPISDDTDWKTFIIFGSPETVSPNIVRRLQRKFPKAMIIGGYCEFSVGYICRDMSEYQAAAVRYRYHLVVGKFPPADMTLDEMCETIRITEGPMLQTAACGVALAGDIPFHAVVCWGLESLTCKQDFTISRSDFYSSGDRPYHLVSEVVSSSSGSEIPLSGAQLLQRFGADAVGIRYPNDDGYSVYASVFDVGDGLMIGTLDDKPMTGCSIDVFRVNRQSMLKDLEESMEHFRTSLVDHQILGALLISWFGRGPSKNSVLGEEMADAKRFATAFPGVPCLGLYAGAGIGPRARARQATPFHTGEACFQGYTAIFGVFTVPRADKTTWAALDDAPTAIREFINTRLRASNSSRMKSRP